MWTNCAATTVTSVQADDDCSISLLSNSWDMNSQDWDDWWWAVASDATAAH